MARPLMIDPSLLFIGDDGRMAVERMVEEEPAYVPGLFGDMLWNPPENQLEPFYGIDNHYRLDFEWLGGLVANGRLLPFDREEAASRLSNEEAQIASLLLETDPPQLNTIGGHPFLGEIVCQEWVFLQTNSWIASWKRSAFDAIEEAGATALQLPRHQWHKLVDQAPKSDIPPGLVVSDTANTVKWIAASLTTSAATGALGHLVGGLLSAPAGGVLGIPAGMAVKRLLSGRLNTLARQGLFLLYDP